ncbi:MAG TPA: DUF4058 family protein, partial [Caldilineaceae bacterium]|nr:DUF4058 family protein [Caldilineaceae bacterium]
ILKFSVPNTRVGGVCITTTDFQDRFLVEIDLLRGGRPGREVAEPPLDTDYEIVVNRASDQSSCTSEIWPVALDEGLPTIPIPLLYPDADVSLDLGAVFQQIYADAYYELRIDYTDAVPTPKLRPAMGVWWEGVVPSKQ